MDLNCEFENLPKRAVSSTQDVLSRGHVAEMDGA
jgi:hypothetical protein